MIDGTSALNIQQNNSKIIEGNLINNWSFDQYYMISDELQRYGCKYIVGRNEYVLLREIIIPENGVTSLTEVTKFRQTDNTENPVKSSLEGSGVNSPLCGAIVLNDTTPQKQYTKPFLAPLDIQKAGSIAEVIPSFNVIQSENMCINIGFDTEFQDYRDGSGKNRRVLSLQMTIAIGETLVRYFFLVDPRYQKVTADGGMIPLKYCLADILSDLKKCFFPDFPLVRKENLVYKVHKSACHEDFKTLDFHEMKDYVIPVSVICHTGKADISVFRRSKYDIDILRKLGEIQGGWMTTESVRFRAANDKNYNYYWLLNLTVRDTLGLTPADNKSLPNV